MMVHCRICGERIKDKDIQIKEKMFGIGESFTYVICESCNCLQIKYIPDNLSKYYPSHYYSYNQVPDFSLKQKYKQSIFNFINSIKGDFIQSPYFTRQGIYYSDKNLKILDIGCGSGKLLMYLKHYGFSDLTGVDPFLVKEYYSRNLRLLKRKIEDMDRHYDLIMSHHSLEHMPDPGEFFNNVSRLIMPNGRLILRIPIYPNYIWDQYGTDWIQLDAPRHLYTFSLKTIQYLCNRYYLRIKTLKYDSTPWSLASTEYCLDGKYHKDYAVNTSVKEEHIIRCKEANENSYGDSVCMEIVKSPV